MISIENFYWVLYEKLLKPANLNVYHYYPFGTTDLLVRNEYDNAGPVNPTYSSAVLFHFDQEPIYPNSDAVMGRALRYSFKLPRILANSEKSSIKKEYCRSLSLLDWYFFYHGFAALDWYRDTRFVDVDAPVKNKFCSLNHNLSTRRSYRMSMMAYLIQKNLLDQGAVSFHGDYRDCERELASRYSYLAQNERGLIQNYLVDEKIQKLILDHDNVNSSFSARLGVHEYRMHQNSFLHLVNETVFYERKLHLTEKIFRPIVTLRPFILVGAPGNLAYLRSYGFQTFDQWINEDYDSIEDHSVRMQMIIAELEKICNRSLDELQSMLREMQEVLHHNKNHFFGQFRRIIVDEMVDNFDQCLRIWNNGRVGDHWPMHPDLQSVKDFFWQN